MGKHLVVTLKDIREDGTRSAMPAALPLPAVNLFSRQMRETYTKIHELAESILARGQLQQGVAAALTGKQVSRYVRDLNALWGTHHTVKEMTRTKIDGVWYYIVLVAGHRRYLACKEASVQKPDLKYRVVLHFGMTSEDALSVQFTENMHEKVPPHEEARTIHLAWLWMLRRHPETTLVDFSRSLNRSPETVRDALRFATLPVAIQQYAHDGKLTYGVLVELSRLAEGMEKLGSPIPETELNRQAERYMVEGTRPEDVRKAVSAVLLHTSNGQMNLFAMEMDKRPFRQVIAQHLIRTLWTQQEYLKTVARHFKDGGFNGQSYYEPETDPKVLDEYSPASPVALLLGLVEYLVSEEEHFAKLAEKVGKQEAEKLRKTMRALRRAQKHVKVLASAEV